MSKRVLTTSLFMALYLSGLYPALVEAQRPSDKFIFEYTYSTPTEGELEDEIAIHEGKLGILAPLSTSKDDGIGFAVGGYIQTDVWYPDNSDYDYVDLYKAKAPIFVDFNITDNLSTLLNVTPGVHTDFEEVNEDDFRVDGSLSFAYQLDKSMRIVAGAAIGEEFGEVEAFPVGGIYWQLSDRLLLDMVLPYPRVQFALAESFRLFAFGEPSGGEWNVGDGRNQVDIQQKGFRLGVGAEYGFTEKSWLYVCGGVEVERELQLAINDNEVFDDEVELDDESFLRVGFKILR